MAIWERPEWHHARPLHDVADRFLLSAQPERRLADRSDQRSSRAIDHLHRRGLRSAAELHAWFDEYVQAQTALAGFPARFPERGRRVRCDAALSDVEGSG